VQQKNVNKQTRHKRLAMFVHSQIMNQRAAKKKNVNNEPPYGKNVNLKIIYHYAAPNMDLQMIRQRSLQNRCEFSNNALASGNVRQQV